MRALTAILFALCMPACAVVPASTPVSPAYETPQAEFDVLKSRLIRTAAALMRANADLCPETRIIESGAERFPICTNKVAIEDSPVKNAQTNGKTIIVTTAMIAALNDDELAFLIAHELAHSVEGDYSQTQSRPPLELAADRTGLYLMARAGYDYRAAITALEKLGIPGAPATNTHPSGQTRMANLRAAMTELEERLKPGRPLIP